MSNNPEKNYNFNKNGYIHKSFPQLNFYETIDDRKFSVS